MNWYHKEIQLGIGAGTLDIMEWIRNNGCLDLSYTEFEDAKGKYIAMVSKGEERMFAATLDAIDNGIYEWTEINGMKVLDSDISDYWMFLIDGNYYWATR